ncbi:uncharacterized protein LOC126575349 [Anopheles aquasalis]|uniref:uncharacterized protein LOC126575349 n=1 Tax=Anopheles aquasalis TaxID=42839 RepID=UPI00215AE7CB|nr:uncharacterized protein LOC126575349 [Anopheles aquasalis]
MKGSTLVCCLLAVQLFGALASDNWKLVPDESGRLRLINTNPYDIPEEENVVEPLFNAETDVIFRLFTRRNPAHGQVLQWNNPASVQNSNFVAGHPTRFTIHGWNGGETSGLHANIRQNYLGVGEFNVIAVDWGAGAQTANYIAARNRVGAVGDIISRMVNTLVSATGTSRNNIYLIGHSLGAHAAGNAGKQQNGQLNTIIGLDPAGPLFSLSDPDTMAPRDAQYTESIFTNAGLLGFDLPLSDANFYPNGGRSQPGCGIDVSGNCAHSRAHELYAESVSTPVGFRATRCASHGEIVAGQCTNTGSAVMGGQPSNQGRGVNGMFIVTTNGNSPFAQALPILLVVSQPVDRNSNWQLVPDSAGRLHLVNTNPYNLDQQDVAPVFNPEQDLIFRLFTRANPTTPQILEFGNPASIAASNFNPAHPTRFTIHGWNSNGNDGMNTNIRNRYHAIGEFNVISVDWSAGAVNPNYIAARNAVGPAGAALAAFIDQLVAAGASPDNMYVIGFSLGAHVAGNAGKGQNGRLNTVIALDPAGPLFSLGQPDAVSPADARYVEMIMTNGGLLGNSVPMGQSTFTPNGGRTQPGCGTDIGGGCAHGRAPAYFAESIGSSTAFRSTRCASIQEVEAGGCTPSGPDANMGGEPSNYGRGVAGVYFLTTNDAAPFARG